MGNGMLVISVVYLGPYPTSQRSPWIRLLPHNSLHRPSSIVTTASLEPAPASQSSLQAQNFLKSTSPDPAPASHCPPKGQLLPHGHLPRPSSCFTLLPSSWWPLKAQKCLKSSFPGPPSASQWPGQAQLLRLLPGCVYTLNSNQTTTSVDIPLAKLLTAYVGPKLPQHKLTRPNSTHMGDSAGRNYPEVGSSSPEVLLTFGSFDRHHSCLLVAALHPAHSSRGMAFPGPLLAFWRPLQAPNFLRPASPGPVAASRPSAPNVLKSGPTETSAGTAPFLRRRFHAPDFLQSASPGPALPPGGICRPTLSSSRTLQGSLRLPVASAGPTRPSVSLRRPTFCLSVASPAARLPQVSLSRPSSSCLPLAS
ncbi:PREDICTED: putative uncharacterized protein FLJ44672 [Cercocebus atys]|uniref:putative uncharacterized protein FLJ44672 n=1 Tax=Cercocebus atys TaxID=9531 RepID=UPI0005F418AB|nr:PREDICTED: putative uncharacterized protein FLJ44672 [Cercocebus atys]